MQNKSKEKQIEEKANFMFFSKRKDLAEEYEQWVNTPLKDGTKIKDCALSVITFMQTKGYQKIDKDSIVLSVDEFNDEIHFANRKGYDQGSKETTEKFIKECEKYKVKRFNPVGIEQQDTGISWIEMPEWKLDEFAKQFGAE